MKKFLKFVCAVVLCMETSGINAVSASAEEGNSKFDKWMDEQFKDTLESDYMTLHYQLVDYESLGIEKPEATIGKADKDSYDEAKKEAQDTLAELQDFDYDSLSETQKHDYDAFGFYLQNLIDLNSYPMMDELFSPSSGIQENLLTNFTEFVFRSQEDVEDYLSVLSSVPGYLDQALELTKQQAERGYFLTDSALNDTEDSIAKFVKKSSDNQLIVIFNEDMDNADFLSEEQKETYKKKNSDIVINQYIPAYQKVSQELEKLRGSRKYEGGYYNAGEDGRKYYAALVRSKTSTGESVQDLFDQCNDFLTDCMSEYVSILYNDRDAEQKYESDEVDMSQPDEILKYLQNHLEDYPQGPEVTYTTSYLDASVANDSTVAYYMQPPIDDIKDNVVRINGDNISNANDLYETLAHEGFPGHLYQITWYLNTNPSRMRTLISTTGYTEGWGMYAEINAWNESGLDDDVIRLHQLETSMGYVMNAAADLAVNGLGYDEQQLGQWMEEAGYSSSGASSLNEYCVDNAGLILPYGIGLMKFLNIREEAKESLGNSFDLKDFNTVLLTNGDRPFEIVASDVNNYIKENGGSSSIAEKESNRDDLFEEPQDENAFSDTSDSAVTIIGCGLILIAVIAVIVLIHTGKKDPFAQ